MRIHHGPRVPHQPNHGCSQARAALRCADGESFSTRTRKFCGTRAVRISVARSIDASVAKIAVGTMCAGWSAYSTVIASPTMEANMSAWNDTGQSLPHEREYVQFAVAGRRFLSHGTFSENRFRSRWGAYQPAEVRWWRRLGPTPSGPSPVQTNREHRYWSDRPMREA